MIDYDSFYRLLAQHPGYAPWLERLEAQVQYALYEVNDGNRARWLAAMERLPDAQPSSVDLSAAKVRAGVTDDLSSADQEILVASLRELRPWRKGPFDFFGITVDTEWRSDWKWDRLRPHLKRLEGRHVLDVGCGNGYHLWRMAAEGADLCVGIDPTLHYVLQFHAVQKYLRRANVAVLPLGIDDMPPDMPVFDTVLSMGLLYHRRSPLDHILQLRSLLKPGGEMVIETIVIEGREGEVLTPEERYAKMANVWFIPTPDTLMLWMRRMGCEDVRCVDVTATTTEEQRSTDWMTFQSFSDFLDPTDSGRTVEGYPAPRRGIFIGRVGAREAGNGKDSHA